MAEIQVASDCLNRIELSYSEPERALNTQETGSGFICIYTCMYVCLWGDHFSEERVKF